jgi:hypothetical protein
MALILRRCNHCGRDVWHYGPCTCPDARLEMVDIERKTIARRLEELDNLERDILGLKPSPQAQDASQDRGTQ